MALLAVLLGAPRLDGQDQGALKRRQATRAELEAAVVAADSVSLRSDDKTRQRLLVQTASIRERLRNGDFSPGDRLYLTVLGDSTMSDTFTVKADQRLALPNIPDISLRGVLDSELAPHLAKELAKYLRDPRVTATGLIRVQLTGGMGRPGFVTVPMDLLVSDLLMAQGGPASSARLDRAQVRRANKTYLDRKQFTEALRVGLSVGDLSLRDGDEIVVPMQTAGGRWTTIWQVTTAITGLFWLIRGFGGRRGFP